MIFTQKLPMEGAYRLQTISGKDGKTVLADTGEVQNMVLNSGFDLACSSGLFVTEASEGTLRVLCVGTGSGAPTPGQTALVNMVASVGAAGGGAITQWSSNDALGYIKFTLSKRFNQGAVVGNITEVGLGFSTTQLFSRALLTDESGNPTSITVRSDEILSVSYELRIYFPQSDIVQNFSADVEGVSVPTVVTIRPFRTNAFLQTALSGVYPTRSPFSERYNGFTDFNQLQPRTADINSPTAKQSTAIQYPPYVNGSAKREMVVRLGLDKANGVNSHLIATGGPICWQMLFDPPISKNNTQVVDITLGYQYTRPE